MRPALACVAFTLLALPSCRSLPNASATPIALDEARAVLDAQIARWNQGDLPGFVATYWDGPELTFLGGNGLTRGRQDLLARYERGYPTPAARGTLSFSVLEFQPLGQDHALLLGRYQLDRQEPASGFFKIGRASCRERVYVLV